jgi:hypothetical protein
MTTGKDSEATATRKTNAQEVATPNVLSKGQINESPITTDALLAAYIDRIASENFTVEAKSAMLTEVRQYALDLRNATQIRRRSDRKAERALKSHVDDCAAFLRNNEEQPGKIFADWCKWIGFAFFGLTVQQFINVHAQNSIKTGSVNWLVVDILVTVILIAIGFSIERPLGVLANKFRSK